MKYGDASILSISPNDSVLATGRPLNPTPQKAKIRPFQEKMGGDYVSMIESKLDPIDESKSNFGDDNNNSTTSDIRGTWIVFRKLKKLM